MISLIVIERISDSLSNNKKLLQKSKNYPLGKVRLIMVDSINHDHIKHRLLYHKMKTDLKSKNCHLVKVRLIMVDNINHNHTKGILLYHNKKLKSKNCPQVVSFEHIQHIYLGFYWFAMSNSMVNPIVYYIMNPTLVLFFS